MDRPRPLSVAEAARALQASEAYVRRLLITRRLFGIKVGPVWGVYEEDLESFKRLRRPPGRPRKVGIPSPAVSAAKTRIRRDRATAGTDAALRHPRRR